MQLPNYTKQYAFIPTIFKEYNGKKYVYSGQFKRDKQLIKDLKRTLFRNGFYTKVQPTGNEFILWCRKR